MDQSWRVVIFQGAGGGLIVWGTFSWHTLGPFSTSWARPPHPPQSNRAPLRCEGNRRSTSWTATVWCCHVKISEECLQQLAESVPWRIKGVLKAKRGTTQYLLGVPKWCSRWVHLQHCVDHLHLLIYMFLIFGSSILVIVSRVAIQYFSPLYLP